MDRDVDVLSRSELRKTNGFEHWYNCRWPYKNYVENTVRYVVRVETDFKLNLSMDHKIPAAEGSESTGSSPEET